MRFFIVLLMSFFFIPMHFAKTNKASLSIDTARIIHQQHTNTVEVYMNLTNHSLQYPITIVGAYSPASKSAKLNRFSFHRGNYIKRHTQKITIHPNSHSDFRQGSVHIELQEPVKTLELGDQIPIHLILADGRSIKVNAIVKESMS